MSGMRTARRTDTNGCVTLACDQYKYIRLMRYEDVAVVGCDAGGRHP